MLLAMIILCPIVRIFTMFPQHFFVLMASHFLYDLCAAAIYVISFTLGKGQVEPSAGEPQSTFFNVSVPLCLRQWFPTFPQPNTPGFLRIPAH